MIDIKLKKSMPLITKAIDKKPAEIYRQMQQRNLDTSFKKLIARLSR